MLSVAIELADQALRGTSLKRTAYARLLCELYEGVRMRMPYRELLEFARATASCEQREAMLRTPADATAPATEPADASRRAFG